MENHQKLDLQGDIFEESLVILQAEDDKKCEKIFLLWNDL